MTCTPSDTDAMTEIIVRAIRSRGRLVDVTAEEAIRDAMSALVPMIAERSGAHSQHIRASAVRRADEHARVEERTAIARDLMDAGWEEAADYVLERGIAAAIRARGEEPR